MTDTPSTSNRLVAVVLALAAAGCLIYAAVSKAWLYNPRNQAHLEVGFGLLGTYECQPAEPDTPRDCRTMSNAALVAEWERELADVRARAARAPDDLQLQAFAAQASEELRASGVFPILGWITLVAIGVAALSLAICAALVLARRRILWPVMPTTTAILGVAIGLITGCVFVATKPGPAGYVGVNLGFFLFGGGMVAGLAAALMLAKELRPEDPDLLADSMDPEHY